MKNDGIFSPEQTNNRKDNCELIGHVFEISKRVDKKVNNCCDDNGARQKKYQEKFRTEKEEGAIRFIFLLTEVVTDTLVSFRVWTFYNA